MDKVLRNVIIFSGVILVIAIFAVIIVYKPIASPSQSSVGNSVLAGNNAAANAANNAGTATNTANTGEVQNVKLSVSGGSYVLTPSVLKKGVPVRMEADLSTVRGCSRDVVISAFGVRKYVSEGDNIITFTPTTTGSINIACSMNMYRGTFTVTDDGTASAGTNLQAVSPAPQSGATPTTAAPNQNSNTNVGGCSMGANGGGCGCGG